MLEQFTYLLGLDGISAEEQAQLDELAAQVIRIKDPNLTAAAADTLLLGAPRLLADLRGLQPGRGSQRAEATHAHLAGWARLPGDERRLGRLEVGPGVALRRPLKLYPDLNHLFVAGEGKSTPAEYEDEGHVAEQVITDIAEWILAQTAATLGRGGTVHDPWARV